MDYGHVLSELSMWWQLLIVISVLIGFVMVAGGVFSIIQSAQGRSKNNYWAGIGAIAVGSMLASMQAWMDAASYTFFSQPSAIGMVTEGEVSSAMGRGEYAAAVALLFGVVQLVGFFGLIKGTTMLKHAFEDGQRADGAWVFIIGGIFSINILPFISMVAATMGTTTADLIHSIFGI